MRPLEDKVALVYEGGALMIGLAVLEEEEKEVLLLPSEVILRR